MSTSRTTRRATVGLAVAAAALLTTQASTASAAPAVSSATVSLDAPATITPGVPTDFTVSVSNPSTGGDDANQRLDLVLSNVASIAASDVTVSAESGGTAADVSVLPYDAQDLVVAVGPYDGTDISPGYGVDSTVTITVDGEFRGPLYVSAQLDTVDSDGNITSSISDPTVYDTNSSGDMNGTQIPKATPYDHPQGVTLSRPSNGSMYYASSNSTGGGQVLQVSFGNGSDTRFGDDLQGSGTAYPVIYRSSTATFYISDFATVVGPHTVKVTSATAEAYGRKGDVPLDINVPAYNPDGVDIGAQDFLGVYRPSTSVFYFQGGLGSVQFGRPGDTPLVGNWDGSSDGDSIGVYRPSNQTFYLLTESGVIATHFGRSGDKPVVGDWNGHGITLIGVHRSNTFILASSNAGAAYAPFAFGSSTDIATTSSWTFTGADLLRTATVSADAPAAVTPLRTELARASSAEAARALSMR